MKRKTSVFLFLWHEFGTAPTPTVDLGVLGLSDRDLKKIHQKVFLLESFSYIYGVIKINTHEKNLELDT